MAYRHQQFQKQMSRQRVLLALYWLSDEDGLFTCATKSQIAQAAGLGIETTERHLQDLERAGDVGFLYRRDIYPSRKAYVLMDHEDAEAALAGLIDPEPRAMSVCA